MCVCTCIFGCVVLCGGLCGFDYVPPTILKLHQKLMLCQTWKLLAEASEKSDSHKASSLEKKNKLTNKREEPGSSPAM